MPKIIPFEKISENKYQLRSEVKISGYDCKIQIPAKLAKKIKGKKIEVTIKVI